MRHRVDVDPQRSPLLHRSYLHGRIRYRYSPSTFRRHAQHQADRSRPEMTARSCARPRKPWTRAVSAHALEPNRSRLRDGAQDSARRRCSLFSQHICNTLGRVECASLSSPLQYYYCPRSPSRAAVAAVVAAAAAMVAAELAAMVAEARTCPGAAGAATLGRFPVVPA